MMRKWISILLVLLVGLFISTSVCATGPPGDKEVINIPVLTSPIDQVQSVIGIGATVAINDLVADPIAVTQQTQVQLAAPQEAAVIATNNMVMMNNSAQLAATVAINSKNMANAQDQGATSDKTYLSSCGAEIKIPAENMVLKLPFEDVLAEANYILQCGIISGGFSSG